MTKKKMRLGSKIFLGLLSAFLLLADYLYGNHVIQLYEITDPFQRFFAQWYERMLSNLADDGCNLVHLCHCRFSYSDFNDNRDDCCNWFIEI